MDAWQKYNKKSQIEKLRHILRASTAWSLKIQQKKPTAIIWHRTKPQYHNKNLRKCGQ